MSGSATASVTVNRTLNLAGRSAPRLAELHDWARLLAEQSKYHTTGIYLGALGIGWLPLTSQMLDHPMVSMLRSRLAASARSAERKAARLFMQ